MSKISIFKFRMNSTEPLYRSIEGESREKKTQDVTEEEDEELELPSFLRNRDF